MIYITKFKDNEEYNSLKNKLKLPNISVALEEHDVYYNPYVKSEESSDSGSGSSSGSGSDADKPILEGNKVLCKYNVSDTSSPVTLYYQQSSGGSGSGSGSGSVEIVPMFSSMEVDGVEQEVTNSYTFDTEGEHTVLFTLPEDVTSIGDSAFSDCDELTSVTIGNLVTSIGKSAFWDCDGLTSVTIGNLVTSIGESAFQECNELTSVTMGNSVTSIDRFAFANCYKLTNVTIPDSVTSIGESAFDSCSGLISVTIGNSVTSMDRWVFNGCSNLISITCNATTAPTIQNNTFVAIKTGGTLTVPTGSTGYDVWMGTDNYYLGKYNWNKVEQ